MEEGNEGGKETKALKEPLLCVTSVWHLSRGRLGAVPFGQPVTARQSVRAPSRGFHPNIVKITKKKKVCKRDWVSFQTLL